MVKMLLKDYIVVVDNVLPEVLADEILAEYEKSGDWLSAKTTSGNHSNIRSCQTIGLSFSSIIEKNKAVRQKIDQSIFNCASKAIKEYNIKFPHCNIQQDCGYEILQYNKGQFYIEHVDSSIDRPRAISCSFALNDEFEGGEFAFFNQKLKYNIPKGSAIMFPSNFMYPHEILPVTSGTRYSIITWFV